MRVYERATEVAEFSRQLAKDFFSAKRGTPREEVLSKAIAVFLMEGDATENEVETLVREFKNLRTPLIRMGREYNTASVEAKIELRDKILNQGLPGDPITRRMWGFKKYPR